MSEPTVPTDAQALLMREVSVPAFFEKLAADAGVSGPDPAQAQLLLGLGDQVTPAVARFVEKQARAGQLSAAAVVEKAAGAAREFSGLPPSPRPADAPTGYLAVPGVRDAALKVAEELRKQSMGAPAAPSVEEEEAEKEKDKVPQAAPAAG